MEGLKRLGKRVVGSEGSVKGSKRGGEGSEGSHRISYPESRSRKKAITSGLPVSYTGVRSVTKEAKGKVGIHRTIHRQSRESAGRRRRGLQTIGEPEERSKGGGGREGELEKKRSGRLRSALS